MDLSETHFSSDVRHPWELARLHVMKHFLRSYIKSPSIQINFVDVGCGDVFFLQEISKSYPDASLFGVDIAFTPEIIDRIRNEFPEFKGKLTPDLAELPLTSEQPADVIFLLDVIEHIQDDRGFLQQLIRAPFIDDGTLFFISVPAFQSVFSSHDVLLGHYRRYTNKSLKKALNESGLQVIESGYFFTSLLAARTLSLAKEKIIVPKQKNTDAGEWKGSSGLTKSIQSILHLDFYVSRIFRKIGVRLPGLSNYAICQKHAS